MNKLRLRAVGKGVSSGGGTIATLYDNRFGTNTARSASTGWQEYDLQSGGQDFFVDSSGGNDANSGQTHALRKASIDAIVPAMKTWMNANPGKQARLLIAGTGNRTYTDNGLTDMTDGSASGKYGGVSVVYPLAFMSYDPADSTGTTTKYGELLGPNRPLINLPSGSTGSFFAYGNTNSNYYAFKGLKYAAGDREAASVGFSGAHNGVAVQNCTFGSGVRFIFPDGTYCHMSKSSGNAPWASSGNNSCIFSHQTDGQVVEDCAFVRGGWRNGVTRGESYLTGGPLNQGHGDYFAAPNTNGTRRRIIYADSAADGANYRGDVLTADCIISVDEPFGGVLAGVSSSLSEKPGGSKIVGQDRVLMGNDVYTFAVPGIGSGFNAADCQLGSGFTNVFCFDAFSNAGQTLAGMHLESSDQITSYLALDKVYIRNYPSAVVNALNSGAPATATWSQINVSVTNALSDSTIASGNGIVSLAGNRVWGVGGAPAAPTITRGSILTSMGFSGATYNEQKASAENWWLEYPHLNWYHPMMTFVAQAMGGTPTSFTATTSLPDTTGLTAPTVVYGTSFTAMSLSDSTFTHSVSKTVNILGIPQNWGVWSDNLPTGFAINSFTRQLTYTGTVAGNTSFTLKCSMPASTPYTQLINVTIS